MTFQAAYVLLIAALFADVFSKPPTCLHLEEHNIPDPESCHHYYHCKDGVPTRAKCIWYQLFDNVELGCRNMWVVDCNAIPPQFPPPVWDNPSSSP